MKWALIFWAVHPGNYTVHSVYLSQDNCQAKQAYYAEKFTSIKANYLSISSLLLSEMNLTTQRVKF